MAKKKFSAKQIAAQKKFAAAAKAGTLKKGSKLKSKSGGSKKGKSKGGKKGGRRMAKKKGRKKSKQGIVSWLVNVGSLAMIIANPVMRAAEASKVYGGGGFSSILSGWTRYMIKDYTGYWMDSNWNKLGWDASYMVRGWGTVALGVGFKKGMSYATKHIKIQSLIPGR